MDSKRPYILVVVYYTKPATFFESTSKNIDSFFKKYDRVAKINVWTTKDKAQYIVAFLELTLY